MVNNLSRFFRVGSLFLAGSVGAGDSG
jgi:hypothetical protein